jgi:hypothetical protein
VTYVSSGKRFCAHLLAGANDYRTVDLAGGRANEKGRRGTNPTAGRDDLQLVQALMKYFRWSPTFSLVMTSPCFFVSEPPALIMARVVCFCQPIAVINLLKRYAGFTLEHRDHLAGLASLPRRAGVRGGYGRFLGPGGLLRRGSLLWRHVGRLWRNGRIRGWAQGSPK